MKPGISLFTGFILILFSSCNRKAETQVMTVNGPVPASSLEISLSHEHVLVDFIGADSTGYHRWDRKNACTRILPYLEEIKALGTASFFECTPAYLGRDPWLLKELSKESGLLMITNTGWYGAHENRFLPDTFYHLDPLQISEIWIREFREGIEGSGVRPGFIKIGVDPGEKLSSDHRKLITAAALTHQQTGLIIASHTGPDDPAFEQLEILDALQVPASAFIWVHAQRGSLEGNMEAARMGAWISLDNIHAGRQAGAPFDLEWYARRISDLRNAGFLDQLLLSHDAGWYSPGEISGGQFRGYTDLFTHLIPLLRGKGFSSDEIHTLLVRNPRHAFAIKL